MKNKNAKLLASFIRYCVNHPEERFYQAFQNWSGHRIYITDDFTGSIEDLEDCYYREKK